MGHFAKNRRGIAKPTNWQVISRVKQRKWDEGSFLYVVSEDVNPPSLAPFHSS